MKHEEEGKDKRREDSFQKRKKKRTRKISERERERNKGIIIVGPWARPLTHFGFKKN